jgi:hypothetical protein
LPVAAIVRLVGLPEGARATLDGAPVDREFSLERSAVKHTLRVVARGCKPFVHEFHVESDVEVWVSLERERPAAVRPEPASSPGEPEPRRLTNPFRHP